MQLTPYLMFNGNCEEALEFYAQALGGEIKNLMRFEGSPVESMAADGDKQRVMHSHFAGNGFVFMASDTSVDGPKLHAKGMVHLNINFDEAAQQEKVFKALSKDGAVGMPLQDTFWGAKFGMVTDRFGICWMLSYEKNGK